MAGKARIYIPGGVYHVMLRGNGGQDIYFSCEDYSPLFLLLQEGTGAGVSDIACTGFCCRSCHLHLI